MPHHARARTRMRALALILAATATSLAASSAPAAATEPRIINGTKVGETAHAARWSAFVSVQASLPKVELSDLESHLCGGVLISPRLVLTAAHCAWGADTSISNAPLEVLAARTLSDDRRTTRNRVVVDDVIVHPQYMTSLGYGGDVAVLRLARPLTGITPMRIVGAGEDHLWGNGRGLRAGARAAGFGLTSALDLEDDELEPSSALREVALPIHPDHLCEGSNAPLGIEAPDFDRATMFCGDVAGTARTARATCYGDSGGPVIVPDGAGGWRLVGITSWGPSRTACYTWGVYARVAALRSWIDSIDEDAGGAEGLAPPRRLVARQHGVSSLMVSWTQPAAGTILRTRVFEDRAIAIPRPWLAPPEDGEDEGSDEMELSLSRLAAGRLTLRPTVRGPMPSLPVVVLRFLRMREATGREVTSVRVDGMEPRRPGVVEYRRLMLQSEDTLGNRITGPVTRVLAPVDARRPSMPGVPRRIGTERGAVALWWRASRDNDRVHHYLVQVRREGERKWRGYDRRTVIPLAVLDDMFSDDDEFDQWLRRQARPNRVRLHNLGPGRYAVRVVAVDRAGHRSTSRTGVVAVPRAVRSTGFDIDDLIGPIPGLFELFYD